MMGIISADKTELDVINKKINDWMKVNIQDYSGTQWGEILLLPTLGKFILIINNDSRNPIDRLTITEKLRYKELDLLSEI